jgi:malate synthase
MSIEIVRDIDVVGGGEILTDDALAFVEELHRRFDPRRRELLAARRARRERIAAG